ncbi:MULTISPECIES: DUF929 family protein [Metallosphaera]|uniref:DUF929 family protein n=1 Tax=Metallosphaera TaxID=41980 RepID=UPI001F057191|nr:DUF929 family protein [Metallosphaera sedula]MCH1772234.1 DUF929 domain-containing protein [Metallosphaera sedula]MCP6728399.1 DUF929 domain-containing protein [Metallosphaera sedula]
MNKKFLVFILVIVIIIAVLAITNLRQVQSSSYGIGTYVSAPVNLELYELAQNQSGFVQFNSTFVYSVKQGNAELTYQGKPVVIFVGAEWCPYCGAEMWSFIIALDRFGNVSGLRYMESSSTDIYPNVLTFTLENLSYKSQYISVLAYEFQDRNHQPLQGVPSNIYQLWQQLGNGSIPFIDVAGIYYQVGTTNNPALLQMKNWTYVLDQLHAENLISYQIFSSANLLTAEICLSDGNQPSHVCEQPAIVHYENELKSTFPSYISLNDSQQSNMLYADQPLSRPLSGHKHEIEFSSVGAWKGSTLTLPRDNMIT